MNVFLDNTFSKFDLETARFFHKLQHNCGISMTRFMNFVSALGYLGIFMICVSLFLLFFAKTRKTGINILASLLLSFVVTGLIIKPIIRRARPYTYTELEYYSWWIDVLKPIEKSFSFPSGHCTASASFAMSIFLSSKNKFVASLIFVFPILTACSRIYLMVHYASDCIFGILVGIICATIIYYLIKIIYKKLSAKNKQN